MILTNTKADPQPVICGMMLCSAGLTPATYFPVSEQNEKGEKARAPPYSRHCDDKTLPEMAAVMDPATLTGGYRACTGPVHCRF